MTKKVVVAMSGGVDSSVAAAMLKEHGYDVSGMILRLWKTDLSLQDAISSEENPEEQAKKVADQLSIPLRVLDAVEPFRSMVVDKFIKEYRSGRTPNPCFTCNQTIKWGLMLDEALKNGADFLATGHYARIVHEENGKSRLYKGQDNQKDQSYVLAGLNQRQLNHALLPLGEMNKTDVRKLAQQLGLSVADRKDSQDMCFLSGEDYRSFLRRHGSGRSLPGEIRSLQGNVIGEHQGLENYTIGQRKGLGSGLGVPYYVIAMNVVNNTLVVGTQEELGTRIIHITMMNWISGSAAEVNKPYHVKIRYKANAVPCKIKIVDDNKGIILLDAQVRDATPGQIAVLYDKDEVIGSGVILSTERGNP